MRYVVLIEVPSSSGASGLDPEKPRLIFMTTPALPRLLWSCAGSRVFAHNATRLFMELTVTTIGGVWQRILGTVAGGVPNYGGRMTVGRRNRLLARSRLMSLLSSLGSLVWQQNFASVTNV